MTYKQSENEMKAEQRELEKDAFWPTIGWAAGTLVVFTLLMMVSSNPEKSVCESIALPFLAIFTPLGATFTYLGAKGRNQELIAGWLAVGVSVVFLVFFPEESKTISFFAAGKQFAMVLYGAAVALVFENTLANREWQKDHFKWFLLISTITFGLPFLAEAFNWPKKRDSLGDICGIFVAATFGVTYIKVQLKARKKSNPNR